MSYGVWRASTSCSAAASPRSSCGVGLAIAAGTAVYVAIVLAARVAEAQYLRALVAGRLRRRS